MGYESVWDRAYSTKYGGGGSHLFATIDLIPISRIATNGVRVGEHRQVLAICRTFDRCPVDRKDNASAGSNKKQFRCEKYLAGRRIGGPHMAAAATASHFDLPQGDNRETEDQNLGCVWCATPTTDGGDVSFWRAHSPVKLAKKKCPEIRRILFPVKCDRNPEKNPFLALFYLSLWIHIQAVIRKAKPFSR